MPGFEPGTSGLWDRRADRCSTPQYINKNIPLLHLFLISFSGKQSMSRSSDLCALLYTRRKGTVLNCMHTKQQSSCPSIYPVSRKRMFCIPQRIKTSMQASCGRIDSGWEEFTAHLILIFIKELILAVPARLELASPAWQAGRITPTLWDQFWVAFFVSEARLNSSISETMICF